MRRRAKRGCQETFLAASIKYGLISSVLMNQESSKRKRHLVLQRQQ